MVNKKIKNISSKKISFFAILTISFLFHHTIKSSSPKKIHNDPAGDMLPSLFHSSLTTQSSNGLRVSSHQITESDKKHILLFIKNHLKMHNSVIMPEDIMSLSLDEDILYIADILEQTIKQLNEITINTQKQLEIISTYLKQH